MSAPLGRRALFAALGSAAGASFGAGRSLAATPLEVALARVADARRGMTTLAGPFEQTRRIGLLAAKVKSRGTLTLVVPDRLRWELAPPDGVVYWVTPEGLAFESARGERGRVPASHAKVAAALEDLRIVLAGELEGLAKRYELRLVSPPVNVVSLVAEPKEGARAGRLARIELEVDVGPGPGRGAPRRVVLVDGPKDTTEIAFGALVRNGPVDAAKMRGPA